MSHLLDGWEQADSICVDLHKWLNVPYDSAVQFTRRQDLQVKVFENVGSYLGDRGDEPDFMHLTPETSRRLRALSAWFTLAAYGRAGHRDIVERNVASARQLGALVEASEHWRLLAPVRLNVACFTLTADPARITEVLDGASQSGEAFLTHRLCTKAFRPSGPPSATGAPPQTTFSASLPHSSCCSVQCAADTRVTWWCQPAYDRPSKCRNPKSSRSRAMSRSVWWLRCTRPISSGSRIALGSRCQRHHRQVAHGDHAVDRGRPAGGAGRRFEGTAPGFQQDVGQPRRP